MADEPDPAAELPPELARLPPGRHGLPREFVVHNHRERLIAGLAAAVAEKGYSATTISDITKHAAISRRTFYEHFESKQDCFLAAYDVVLKQIRDRVADAAAAESDWPHRVHAGIRALLAFLAAEPELARLGMVESMVAGPEIAARHRDAVDSFVAVLRGGRAGLLSDNSENGLPETTEEAVVGGIALLIARRVIAGKTVQLPSLLPDLTRFALTPYIGADEAAAVAAST
jgi:AcrR family transcriptional regulator